MSTYQMLFNDLMFRVKNLQQFEVTITMPPDFEFKGTIPFDMKIVGDEARVTLLALDSREAAEKVEKYFYGTD